MELEGDEAYEQGSSSISSSKNRSVPPLWQFVTKLDTNNNSKKDGGNVHFCCNFCNNTYCGSYSRVKAHLLKISGQGVASCLKVTRKDFTEMLSLQNDYTNSLTRPVLSKGLSANYNSLTNVLKVDNTKKRNYSGQPTINDMFKQSFKDELDAEIARMFYSGGVPFNVARNPHYKRSFALLADACKISDYSPPSYDALRTKLLKNERRRLELKFEKRKNYWDLNGISLVSEGWSDPIRRPLINFIAVNNDGPMFLQAVNCEGKVKDSFFIAKLIDNAILNVGAGNIVQIITDNSSACRSACIMMEEKYPQIFWTPCVVHTLNRVVKNIFFPKKIEQNAFVYAECSWINKVLDSITMIKNFISGHSMAPSIFRQFPRLQMLNVVDTRFASAIVTVRRFKKIGSFLRAMVIDEKWNSYRSQDEVKARLIREKLLSESFWEEIDYIIAFTEPIYDMIRMLDIDSPTLHMVYPSWLMTIAKVKKIIYAHEKKQQDEQSLFWDAVHYILEKRRVKCVTPVHAIAYSLNPKCATSEWQCQYPGLVPPQSDPEVYRLRKECVKRLFPDEKIKLVVNNEFAAFLACSGDFNDDDSKGERATMDPLSWWTMNGAAAPHLQYLALRLFRQVSSSSCCERNWSTYKFIHSAMKNTLAPELAEDLVFVHTNLRLLSRKSPEYADGESKLWDIAGDGNECLTKLGLTQYADLSLDEPEFEEQIMNSEAEIEGLGSVVEN